MFKISKVTKSMVNKMSFAKSRFMAEVDVSKCTGCRTCADKRCPVGAIHMKFYPEYGEKRSYVDEKECIGCGLCVLTCPAKARKMKIVRPPEYIPEPTKTGINDILAANEG
jgi:NAD-dependent dihydropyrimidine dehydrogenase PreA subunit